MVRALDPASVIAGEAVSGTPEERWNDMVAIASVIANRAAALGVTPQQVIANTNEFNAYNRAMPAGTPQLVDMATEAMKYVEENGPINNATFYATPAATDNLPSGLLAEGATTGHQYFSDPQNRAIGTSLGYRQPNQYAYAANPENVPTPGQPSLMGPAGEIGQGWAINGVAPHLGPVPETWSSMAAANPVQTPTSSAQPSGLLGAATPNGFAELAAAGPLGGQYASPADRMGLLSAPSISQADIDRALSNPTSQGMDPSFTAGLMGPSNPVVPTSVETTSYTQPSAVADLGSFPDAIAAQRGILGTGIYSPEHLAVQAQAEKQLAASRAVQSGLLSSYVAPTSITPAEQAISSISPISMPGMLQNVQQQMQVGQQQTLEAPNFQQALNPSLPTMNNPWAPNQIVADPRIMTPDQVQSVAASLQSSPPTGFTTPGMTPQQIAGYQQAANTMAQAGMLNIGQQPPTDLSGNLPTNFNVLSPALETVSIPDQPTVAEQPTIEGPATTPAVSQQAQMAAGAKAAQQTQTLGDKLKSAMNPGTAIGGILGGATLGPIGGILGGLLGNAINQNGFSGLGGLLGNQAPVGTNYGFNPGVVAGIYGGGYAPGTSAIASDGSRVSAQGGGDTARTNTYGVTDVENSYGGYASDWSGWY